MLELLAAIQSVEPAAWPLVAVFLFSAALYPLGLFMPCSCCCNPCEFCDGDSALGQTVSVAISGMPDQGQGDNLCVLEFSSTFGSGAAGHVAAPGGESGEDDGPITSVVLTNKGTGYAVFGRVEPTLTISGGSGSGATFAPTLSQSTDINGFDLWSLESVAISGGSGYLDGDVLTITEAVGDTQVVAAAATIRDKRVEPTITISGNATATVSVSPTGNYSWEVDAVTVTAAGTGYSEGGAITFSADGNDTTVTSATGTAQVVHDEPENAVITITTAGGSGAVLVPVWELLPESQWPAPHKKLYRLQSMTVTNGGSGYQDYDLIDISFSSAADGTVTEAAYIDADIVGGSGEILQVYIAEATDINTPAAAGKYIGSQTDGLHSVVVTNAGEYYEAVAGALDVFVSAGGSYYREDANEPPYVATVTVNINQTSPSAGSGAVLTAVIDDNTASGTFGQITSVTITNGGTDYLAWEYINSFCCADQYNRAFVLHKDPADCCRWLHYFCGAGSKYLERGWIELILDETGLRLAIIHEGRDDSGGRRVTCNTLWTLAGPIDCNNIPELTADNTRLARIVDGGEYNAFLLNPSGTQSTGYEPSCHSCCRGSDSTPLEIAVSLANKPWYDAATVTPPLANGAYVLSWSPGPDPLLAGIARWQYVDGASSITVVLQPSDSPSCWGSCEAGFVVTASTTSSTGGFWNFSDGCNAEDLSGTLCAASGSCETGKYTFSA